MPHFFFLCSYKKKSYNITPIFLGSQRMHNHYSPDSEGTASSPELEELISQERTRTASIASNKSGGVHIPQLLNPRTSMIIPSGGRSPLTSPSPSPRTRIPSITQTNRQPQQQQQDESSSMTNRRTSESERVSLESEQEKERELRAYFENLVVQQNQEIRQMEDKADKQRKFISDTLKGRVMGQKRSIIGVFDQSDDSETNEPFCVTVPSTPCDTPPPERVLSERTTHTQISKMYDMLSKISTRISALETNIARINNERLVDSQRRLDADAAEAANESCCCCLIC